MSNFIKQKTATFSRPRIIVKYMDTSLTTKPLTTATPVDGYAVVDGDIVLFTGLSSVNYTIHRATVSGVNITWTQLALGQNANGLPALGDEVFIQAGTYTKKIYWYDGSSFIEFKSGGGLGDSSIYGVLNSQDDAGTALWTKGNNATFLTAGTCIGTFTQKNETSPLNGKSSYTFVQGATSINDWIASYAVTLPNKAKGITNKARFVYSYDGNYGDILPVIWDVANSKIISSTSIYLSNTNGVAKTMELVYDVPANATTLIFGFQVKVTNNTKTLKFDDIELGVYSTTSIQTVEQEFLEAYGNGGTSISNGTIITFSNIAKNSLNNLGTWTSNTTYTAKKSQTIVIKATLSTTAILGIDFTIVKNGTTSYSGDYITSTVHTVTATIDMNVGDYIYITSGGAGTLSNDNRHRISIAATSVRDNVIQAWQDGMATTATYTMNIGGTTTAPTKATSPTFDIATWYRDGEYMVITYTYSHTNNAGAANGSGAYLFPIPNGYQINTSKLQLGNGATASVSPYGTVVGNLKYANTTLGAANYSSNGLMYVYSSTQLVGDYLNIAANQSYPFSSGLFGNTVFTSATALLSFTAKVPIVGWSSTPTLLALPTSKENVFSARISSTGTIISQNLSWISSVVKNGTGDYTINFNTGITNFTTIPSMQITTGGQSGTIGSTAAFLSQSTTSVRYIISNDVGTEFDSGHDIIIQKQSPDYTAPGVFVGNVQPEWQYDLTVTGTNWTTTRAVGVVYKMASGQYRMRFNVTGTVSSASRTTYQVTFSGVTFKTSGVQTVTGWGNQGTATTYCYVNSGASTLDIGHSTGAGTVYFFSGDVELESKPAWAVNTN